MLRVRSLITPTCHQHHHYKHCWPRDLQPTEEIAKRLQCVVFHLYLWHCHPDVHSSGTNCEWLCWPFKLSMNQASLLASGGYNSMCPKKITSILPGKLYEQNMARLRWRVWSHSWNLLRQGWRKRFSPSWSSSWNHFVWSRFIGNMSICQIHHLQNPEITLLNKDSKKLNVQVTDLRVSCEMVEKKARETRQSEEKVLLLMRMTPADFPTVFF